MIVSIIISRELYLIKAVDGAAIMTQCKVGGCAVDYSNSSHRVQSFAQFASIKIHEIVIIGLERSLLHILNSLSCH